MSRWDAVSDYDYDEERNGPCIARVDRTCGRCGQRFEMDVDLQADYQVQVWCDGCIRTAMQTQDRQAQQIQAVLAAKANAKWAS